MLLHRTLQSMESLDVVAPLPSWQHRDSCVVDVFATKSFPAYTPSFSNCSLKYGVVTFRVGEFEGVPLRENVSGIMAACRLSPARTLSGFEVFLKTVSIMMGCRCYINGEAMVSIRPISLQLSCFSCLMCSSDESLLAYSHSSKYALCKVSPVGIQKNVLYETHFFSFGIQKCWCGTIATMLASFWTGQSRRSLFFPCLNLLDCDHNCTLSVL